MNPGAVGKQGFHQKRTMLRFEIKKCPNQELRSYRFGQKRSTELNLKSYDL